MPTISGEKTIYKCNNAVLQANIENNTSNTSVHLVLTDQNLYMHYPSMWTGKIKETKVIPLRSINVINGEAQVFTKTFLGFQHFLVLNTPDLVYEILMTGCSKSDVKRWADYISMRLTGEKPKPASTATPARPVNTSAEIKPTGPINVNRRCIACRAPISGTRGEKVKCVYCDTEQNL